MYQTGGRWSTLSALMRSGGVGLTLPGAVPILSCVIRDVTLRLALALLFASHAPLCAQAIGTAGGLLHSPPSVGTIAPSGPAIERIGTDFVPRPLNVPTVSSPPLSSVLPPGFVDTGFTTTPTPFVPIFTPPIITTIGPALTVYPQGYGVYTDQFGRRSFIPRGSSPFTNRYDEPRQPLTPVQPAPPSPPPAPTPEPVVQAPEQPPQPPAPPPEPDNPVDLTPDATLDDVLRREVEARPGLRASIVVFDLLGRRRGEYHSPGDFYPSTMMRLPILTEASRQIARGQLDVNKRVELALPESDDLSRKLGEYVSIGELMARMIRRGDHRATNALIDLLGIGSINEGAAAAGMRDTALSRRFNEPAPRGARANRMPAADAAFVMYRLLRKTMPEIGMAGPMLNLLARTGTTEMVPRLLHERPGCRVWDLPASARLQSGREVANDVAIVTAPGHAYVLAVYTDAPVGHEGWIGDLAVRVHDALTGRTLAGYSTPGGAD